jgi:hypothetical protein
MIRNLKILIATVTALAAFGALRATAHAAEEFHCSVEPCRATPGPDEAAGTTTAHHVFVIKGTKADKVTEVAVTLICNQLTGEGTSATKTATDLGFTNLKYENSAGERKCEFGGSETVEVDFTSCYYTF